jgi:hypothetical protein
MEDKNHIAKNVVVHVFANMEDKDQNAKHVEVHLIVYIKE